MALPPVITSWGAWRCGRHPLFLDPHTKEESPPEVAGQGSKCAPVVCQTCEPSCDCPVVSWISHFLTIFVIGITVAFYLGKYFGESVSTPPPDTSVLSLPSSSFLSELELGFDPLVPTASAPAIVRGKVKPSFAVETSVDATAVGAWKPRKKK